MDKSRYFKMLRMIYDRKRLLIKDAQGVLRTEKMCKYFGDPQKKFDTIHIAGTNAKGSVSFKLSEIFRISGSKTGLYTSPHLHIFRERIQINKEMIPEEIFSEYLKEIFKAEENLNLTLSFFEIPTIACFRYFADQQADVAMIETGLGGIYDPTNVIEPLVSVITTVGEDHKELLGNSLNEIAKNKAGIIKKNKPCVIGRDLPANIFFEKCKEMNSDLYFEEPCRKYSFTSHQDRIIIKVVEVIDKYYPSYKIKKELLNFALNQSLPCRMQVITPKEIFEKLHIKTKAQALILDVGHNPPAIEHFLKCVQNEYHKKARVLLGIIKGKDFKKMIEILLNYSSHIYPIQGKHPKMLSSQTLYDCANSFKKIPISLINKGNIKDSIIIALNEAEENEIVIICGSFYIMTETKEALNFQIDKDPEIMNN